MAEDDEQERATLDDIEQRVREGETVSDGSLLFWATRRGGWRYWPPTVTLTSPTGERYRVDDAGSRLPFAARTLIIGRIKGDPAA